MITSNFANFINWSKLGTTLKNGGRWLVVDLLFPLLVMKGSAGLIMLAARGVYSLGVKLLGDRENYQAPNLENQKNSLDRFRLRCWKVIRKAEDLEQRIDKEASRVLGIRSAAEVEELRQKFAYEKPSNLEMLRVALPRQIKNIFTQTLPDYAGFLIAEKLGFSLLGGRQFLILSYIVNFFGGLSEELTYFDYGRGELKALPSALKAHRAMLKFIEDDAKKTIDVASQETMAIVQEAIVALETKIAKNPYSRRTSLEQEAKDLADQAEKLKKEISEKLQAEKKAD